MIQVMQNANGTILHEPVRPNLIAVIEQCEPKRLWDYRHLCPPVAVTRGRVLPVRHAEVSLMSVELPVPGAEEAT
jgi:hypothetical protein